ncbi:hypothetical protein P692DRAFT_201651012, partial [Suillus brevipes Sb2]
LFNEMQFDLRVVRYSMLVDFLLHGLVWSQFMFIGATSLSCIGAGVVPGMQSLALCTLRS